MKNKPMKSIVQLLCLGWLMMLVNIVQAEVVDIDNPTLKTLLAEGIPLVDLRTQGEWAQTGVVAGSIEETFFDEAGKHRAGPWLESVGNQTNGETALILICHSGVRSKVVADWLVANDLYGKVYNVKAGIDHWIRSGGSVTMSEAAAAN